MITVRSSKRNEPYVWEDRPKDYSIPLGERLHYVRPILFKQSYRLADDFKLQHVDYSPPAILGQLIDVHWEGLHENLRQWTETAFLLSTRSNPIGIYNPMQFYLLFKPHRSAWTLWRLKGSAVNMCKQTPSNYTVCKSFISIGQKVNSGSHIHFAPDFVELRRTYTSQQLIFWDEFSQDVFEFGYSGITHTVTQKCVHEWETDHQAMFLYTITCTKCGLSRSYDSSG